MKYIISDNVIPTEQRQDVNDKIQYIINQNLSENETGISTTDIANAYTGIGGLHGLNYGDYNSYYDYQKAKSEIEQGQFFTPYQVSEWIMNCLKPKTEDLVLDLCCGHGSFINSAQNEYNFYGCELDVKSYKVAEYLYPNAKLQNTDIRMYNPKITFDFVVGNPPYNLIWRKDNESYLSEYYYCLKAAELLKPCGIMAIIVPQSFLADDFSDKSMIERIEKHFNYIIQIPLAKDTFKALGVTNYKTKILILQKKSEYIEDIPFKTDLTDISDSDFVYREYIEPLLSNKEKIKRKLLLENLKSIDNDDFSEKIIKLLYDIKRNPKTNIYLAECQEYINQFRNQSKPDCVKYEEWEKIKIKDIDVLKNLRNTLSKQNYKQSQENRLIKHNYDICYNKSKVNIYDMIYNNTYDFEDKSLLKTVMKKRKQFENQSQNFCEMLENINVKNWLDKFELVTEDDVIKLNSMQNHDINLFLQKQYCFVQWEQGSGKTICGIAQGNYRLENNNVKNVFVVSTAIAIKNNWNEVLEQYKIDYTNITKAKDIESIKDNQYVTITLDMLCKYHKQIKRFIKSKKQNVMLLFDESDNISNPYSKRTKAVLNAFRKVKYKVLMTGTSTRNNIAEISTQFELLYNNSYNMISECEYIYEQKKQKEENVLVKNTNEYYQSPIPAYRKGYSLFSASHIPEKITVFGVKQKTQDIYNSKELKNLINKTIITRTFEEVTGKNLYEIKQVFCKFNNSEKELYRKAIEEFYKMEYLFSKTGNSRKDAMLRILNQLILLLKICAAPQTIQEYSSLETPNKFTKVLDLLDKFKNERVAIGVRHISVADAYRKAIQENFPNRPVFYISGNTTTLKQRRDIVKALKQTENGILISTQQSLSASMNIDFVDKCIIPELHWNNSSMSQYYFRFIRYTSTRFKQIYFVTYENSIESNLLKMILQKDKLNLFMKNQELSDEEIYDKYGIDDGLLKNLMYKEKTENGYKIRWGESVID